jgi:hypothetical protein
MLDGEGIQINSMGILVSADWFLQIELFRKLVVLDNVAKRNGRPGERMSCKLAWRRGEWLRCFTMRVVENASQSQDDDGDSSAEVM